MKKEENHIEERVEDLAKGIAEIARNVRYKQLPEKEIIKYTLQHLYLILNSNNLSPDAVKALWMKINRGSASIIKQYEEIQ